jgi:parallel beta-helix repeat protein
MANDGSQAHPWGSLSAVVAAGKLPPVATATVAPGDAIYLLNGNHGLLRLDNAFNSDFISIQAAPGQTPILSGITIYGGSHWLFSGLTIQNLNDGGYTFGVRLIADDVIFTGCTILSQADVSGWTQADWRQYAITGINTSGSCIAITNNTIRNVGFGIGISGSNILVHGNSVDHFGDDGIDFGQGTGAGTTSNIEISNNTLTNNLNIGDGNHNDGIQGWVLNGTTGSNVLIDSNSVISKTDPALPWLGGMQGISEFDGAWDNIQITNNVVIAAAYHGISLYGAQNSTIINNTVFGNFVATNGDVNDTWVGVFNAQNGTPPAGVVVRNNISSVYSLVSSGVTADHNVTATNPVGLFVTFDRPNFQYNLRPAPGSVALGFGSSQLAPAHDITGAPRTPPITAGAYQ